MPDPAPKPAAAIPAGNAGSRALGARLFSTVVLWGVIILALRLRTDWPLLALGALAGMLGAWEYARLQADDAGARPFTRLLLALAAAYWLAVAWQVHPAAVEPAWWVDAVALAVAVHGAFLVALRFPLDGERTLLRIMNTVFGFAYTTLSLGFLIRVLFFDGADNGRHLLLFVILVVKSGDMGAYALGCWLGRHKMIPHVSPGKSWEGFGGAVLGSLAAAAVMMGVDGAELAPLSWAHAGGLALTLCLVGVVGDLAESILKRCHHLKDSGHALPGIGGVLDLTDSLLFAAPTAYFYLRAIA